MDKKLKPCPFCGGVADSVHNYVCCNDVECGGFGIDVPVEIWNRRPVEMALESELAPFRDQYFNGLTMVQIAELAIKSIKITTANCEACDRIEKLEEAIKHACNNCWASKGNDPAQCRLCGLREVLK